MFGRRIPIKFKKMHPQAVKPRKSREHSNGYDLFPVDSGIIPARGKAKIPLGFATEFPFGVVALLNDRSGMGSKGKTKMAGVIDADYRGEWSAIIQNNTDDNFEYSPQNAIIQVLFIESLDLDDQDPTGWFDELSSTERGDAGFGSSDQGRVINESLDFHSKAECGKAVQKEFIISPGQA